jgi:hypothetical protein
MGAGGSRPEHAFAIDVRFVIAIDRPRTARHHSALRRDGDELR